jgi:hypothetical protein
MQRVRRETLPGACARPRAGWRGKRAFRRAGTAGTSGHPPAIQGRSEQERAGTSSRTGKERAGGRGKGTLPRGCCCWQDASAPAIQSAIRHARWCLISRHCARCSTAGMHHELGRTGLPPCALPNPLPSCSHSPSQRYHVRQHGRPTSRPHPGRALGSAQACAAQLAGPRAHARSLTCKSAGQE